MAKPNVLIVHTDEQSWWTISAYGGTLIETPNIDRLAREGALFCNFFANSALCTPSRGCFLTGRYPHCHGAYTNNVALNRDEITVAHVLRESGYDTGYAGKWHLDGRTVRPAWVHPDRSMGFDDARFMFNRGHFKKIEIPAGADGGPERDLGPTVYPYGIIGDEKTYMTDWLTDRTLEFIGQPRERPFFYMVSIPDPHMPFTVRAPYDTLYRPEDMPLPATFSQEDLPTWIGHHGAEGICWPADGPERETKLKHAKAQYSGQVKLIDDCVGRVCACLEAQGILDDTVLVFTTDHGEYMGEHGGLLGKNLLYETAYRIPLIMRWPQRIPAGTAVERIVSLVDFQQTLLGLLGLAPCGREQGRDASALVCGQEADWEDQAFIHHSTHNMAGIFTPDYELGLVRDDEPVLFDRRSDPHQKVNLARDPAYADAMAGLAGRVARHHARLESPASEWLPEAAENRGPFSTENSKGPNENQ